MDSVDKRRLMFSHSRFHLFPMITTIFMTTALPSLKLAGSSTEPSMASPRPAEALEEPDVASPRPVGAYLNIRGFS